MYYFHMMLSEQKTLFLESFTNFGIIHGSKNYGNVWWSKSFFNYKVYV